MEDSFIPVIELEVEENEEIDLSVIEGEMPDPYNGDYTVFPKIDMEQTLKTKNKSMIDDVHVMEVPISEVSNKYGKTLIIGGL